VGRVPPLIALHRAHVGQRGEPDARPRRDQDDQPVADIRRSTRAAGSSAASVARSFASEVDHATMYGSPFISG
jgi:hypothetical protein